MDLSIVIISYNTKNLLKKCLGSLASHPTKSSETIVVDNASTDGSVEMVGKEFPEITPIANKTNKGFGAANNQGAKIAKGKYLLFLNPDTTVDRNFDELLKFMEKRPDVGILGCRLVDEGGKEQPHIAGFKHNVFSAVVDKFTCSCDLYARLTRWRGRAPQLHFRNGKHPLDVDWVTGACMLTRQKVFEELNGFDERFFMYFEDEDLCLRAKQKGWQVIFYPGFAITHISGAALGKDKKSRWDHYFESQELFYKKHHGPMQNLLLKVLRSPFRTIFRS